MQPAARYIVCLAAQSDHRRAEAQAGRLHAAVAGHCDCVCGRRAVGDGYALSEASRDVSMAFGWLGRGPAGYSDYKQAVAQMARKMVGEEKGLRQ